MSYFAEKSELPVRKEYGILGQSHYSKGIRGRTKAARVEEIEGSLPLYVFLVRDMGVTEENDVGARFKSEIFNAVRAEFHVVKIAVCKDDTPTEKLNLFSLHYGSITEKARKIAISAHCEPSLVGKIDGESVGVRKTVAEEEYRFRVGVERYGA